MDSLPLVQPVKSQSLFYCLFNHCLFSTYSFFPSLVLFFKCYMCFFYSFFKSLIFTHIFRVTLLLHCIWAILAFFNSAHTLTYLQRFLCKVIHHFHTCASLNSLLPRFHFNKELYEIFVAFLCRLLDPSGEWFPLIFSLYLGYCCQNTVIGWALWEIGLEWKLMCMLSMHAKSLQYV